MSFFCCFFLLLLLFLSSLAHSTPQGAIKYFAYNYYDSAGEVIKSDNATYWDIIRQPLGVDFKPPTNCYAAAARQQKGAANRTRNMFWNY